jgi:hypothetical protein
MKTIIKILVTFVFGLFMLIKTAPMTNANSPASLCYDLSCIGMHGSGKCSSNTDRNCWNDFSLLTESGMQCDGSTHCSC